MRRMATSWVIFSLLVHGSLALVAGAAEPIILRLTEPSRDGVVMARVSDRMLPRAAEQGGSPMLRAVSLQNRQQVPAQFVPDSPPGAADAGQAGSQATGTVWLRVPPNSGDAFELTVAEESVGTPAPFDGSVVRRDFVAEHRVASLGGLPSRFRFVQSGKDFSQFAWHDRVHHRELGGFSLRDDQHAQVKLISEGPVCTVVRVEAAYTRPDGTQPPSRPRAVYQWHYLHELPLVYVTATISQDTSFEWQEVHFLELNFPGSDFLHWAGDGPGESGELVGDNGIHHCGNWAGVFDGQNGIGMFGCGAVLVHDGRGAYGTYLHADGDRTWQAWSDTTRAYSAWLWLGTHDQPATAVRLAHEQCPVPVSAVLSPSSAYHAIRAAQETLPQDDMARAARAQHVAWAARLEAAGRFGDARVALNGTPPQDWKVLSAGDLHLALQHGEGGVRLESLLDSRSVHEHAPIEPAPLFRITLHNTVTGEEKTLAADRGWEQVQLSAPDPQQLTIRWAHPDVADIGDLAVTLGASAVPADHAIHWTCEVAGQQTPWSLERVAFPQLRVVAPGTEPVLLFPRGPGELRPNAWRETFSFGGLYPNGWTSMQFMAAYDRASGRGIYWGLHDPLASTKDLAVSSDIRAGTVTLSADHPVANMRQAGNRFVLSGKAVWQTFTGDWFDAAQIYRRWVRAEARWFPELSPAGREDTPLWMRELSAWAQTGGPASACVEPVQQFAQFLGVPVGYHWYSWHLNPFDNDYPHYFPTTPGFTEGVTQLQASQVHVMPYINGRLWDTRDRGLEDFEFTGRALPATTKNGQGEPFTEQYGSKESDGSNVTLAVMCPTTALWQDQIRGILSQLFTEHRVAGVYIDQIAAAPPALCMDPNHGHPLGGGSWWNEGYWQMLDRIRQEKPAQAMLTTECNAEPFVRWFDGYLTWHWQFDGQVPAFPAVYGGAIQMFGRAYRGGPTKDLALRMKAGQQLVFGEQIGWLDPHVTAEEQNAAFLRRVVQARWQLRRYFYAGDMLRPPRLDPPAPTVRADWQWQDSWWVTTDAVLTGAWSLPQDRRAVALFVNVSDEPVQTVWTCDCSALAGDATHVQLTELTAEGRGPTTTQPRKVHQSQTFPPRSVLAIEITPETK